MNNFITRRALTVLTTAMLAACGGGGGGGGGTADTSAAASSTPEPVQAAVPIVVDELARNLYVSPGGLDSATGTQEAPLQSIRRASELATPGTTVHVAPGNYPGGFQTTASGTPAARIRYVSDVPWAARIVPPPNSTSDTAWWNMGSNIDIEAFEFDGSEIGDGTAWGVAIYATGSNNVIRSNHVHHIANAEADCTNLGGAGIDTDSQFGGTNNDVLANVVHDIGFTGCNFIHGLYIISPGNVKNNIVYRIGNAGIHLWHDAHDINVINNTVVDSGTGILVGNDVTAADNVHVLNNIVTGNDRGITEEGSVGMNNTYTNNLVFMNRQNWNLFNPRSDNITADPQFVDPGNSDYRLLATSPAIGKGTATLAPVDDVVRALRPPGSIDIGAFQHGG